MSLGDGAGGAPHGARERLWLSCHVSGGVTERVTQWQASAGGRTASCARGRQAHGPGASLERRSRLSEGQGRARALPKAIEEAPPKSMDGAPAITRCRTAVRGPDSCGKLLWEIQGLDKQAMAACGRTVLVSSSFSAGSVEWRAFVYPNGETEKKKGHVSAFVEIVTPGKAVECAFSLSVGGKCSGKLSKKFGKPDTRHSSNGDDNSLPKGCGPCWGHSCWREWSHDALEKRGALSDGKLIIEAEVCVAPKAAPFDLANPPMATLVEVSSDESRLRVLASDMGALQNDTDSADTTVVVGEEEFRVHAAVLSARSSVFKALLHRKGDRKSISLSEIEPDVFKLLLRYLYTGELPQGDAATVEMHQHLLVAADRFDVASLFQACECALVCSLSVESVGYTLVLAEQHGAKILKSTALQYVTSHAREVTMTRGWWHLIHATPMLQSEAFLAALGCQDTRVVPPPAAGVDKKTTGAPVARQRRKRRA